MPCRVAWPRVQWAPWSTWSGPRAISGGYSLALSPPIISEWQLLAIMTSFFVTVSRVVVGWWCLVGCSAVNSELAVSEEGTVAQQVELEKRLDIFLFRPQDATDTKSVKASCNVVRRTTSTGELLRSGWHAIDTSFVYIDLCTAQKYHNYETVGEEMRPKALCNEMCLQFRNAVVCVSLHVATFTQPTFTFTRPPTRHTSIHQCRILPGHFSV